MSKQVTVLYDSLCPVCRREVKFLDAVGRRGDLRLIDIAGPQFNAADFGLTMDECIGSLRGFDRNGRPIAGMETIRAMYEAVGLGWLVSWTKKRPFAPICDRAYDAFARIRPRLSALKSATCTDARCDPR